ncbi:hypothetical protein RRG08_015867 [Elysia crispata]|uniref:Uncharacterized protein n=1 Tax=Elysia crispata TaxID=231223 RepID=A0AAE0XQP7_9GAST|nr:hypothetical protein RRG08_015867 [Elysia crispata]
MSLQRIPRYARVTAFRSVDLGGLGIIHKSNCCFSYVASVSLVKKKIQIISVLSIIQSPHKSDLATPPAGVSKGRHGGYL